MKQRFTEDSWHKEPRLRSLIQALHACGSEEQLGKLLRDIGTLSELQAWSERLEIARLLGRGLSYRQVATMTGASTTTVTKVAHVLENGTGGYRDMLKVHRHQEVRRAMAGEAKESVLKKVEQNLGSENQEERTVKMQKQDLPMKPLQKYLTKSGNNPAL